MTLLWLIAIPFIGAVVAGLLGRQNPKLAPWTSMITMVIGLIVSVSEWVRAPAMGSWIAQVDVPWIPALSVRVHLAMDGISLPLIVLTFFIGIVAVGASWEEIHERVGFFYFNLLALLAAVVGVFLAMDLVLFYFFWELMLVPMYLLIGIWGYEGRLHAAIKFFLFTQASGMLLLLSILGLHFAHLHQTGVSTFDYQALLGTALPMHLETWLMLGFFAAFATKVPVWPLHPWLPDAHTQAPTGGSVILAGLLLKTGAYGMIRFLVPLFPHAAKAWGPTFMTLGLIGVLYGAWLAFAQTDAKRLVAYTSVSHLGFVVMAIFAWNKLALQGALFEMICHGFSTGALFVVVGMLYHRMGTRDLRELGGLWENMPRFGVATLFFSLAALGLPGLGNFIAEFLCLVGTFSAQPLIAAIGTLGLVAAAVYSLWLMQRTFQGKLQKEEGAHDLNGWEFSLYGAMAVLLLWLGLYPQPVIDVASGAFEHLLTTVKL